jgi:phage gpG-like protein
MNMYPTYDIGTNKEYAAIQEFGGIIRPKNAPYLVFEIDGVIIQTTRVKIPAQPYMRPGFDESRVEAGATVGKLFEKLVLARHYEGL